MGHREAYLCSEECGLQAWPTSRFSDVVCAVSDPVEHGSLQVA